MLKKIDIYIFGQVFRALGFSLLALLGMFWIGKTIPLIELVILRGETASTFFRLSSYLLPSIIKLMLPIATLIAVIFTLNRMSNDGELLSIHNSGRDPMSILIPLTQIGVFLSLLASIFSLWLVPASLYGIRIDLEEISQNYSKNIITAEKFLSPDDNLYVYVEDSVLSGEMLNVFIDDRRSEDSTRNYFADRALLVKADGRSKIALIEGKYHERNIETGQISVGTFDRLELALDIDDNENSGTSYSIEEMPLSLLVDTYLDSDRSSEALGELIDRISFPLLNLLLALIGALGFLTSSFSRHGYGKAVVFGVLTGLFMEAYVLAMRNIISNQPSLAFLALLPIGFIILALIIVKKLVRGRKI